MSSGGSEQEGASFSLEIQMESAAVNWNGPGWTVLLLVALTALPFLLLINQRRLVRKSKARLPPGPSGVPVFGNLGLLARIHLLHQELHRLAQEYGPIMSLRLGLRQAIVVSSPEVAKEVLKDRDQEFSFRPYTSVVDIMGFGDHYLTFITYGPHWRFLRRLVTSELLSLKKVQQFQHVWVEEVGNLVKCILEEGCTGAVDLKQTSSYLTKNMMSRVLIGKRICFYNEADARNSSASQQNQASATKALVDEVILLTTAPLIRDYIPWLGFLDNLTTYKARMRKLHKQLDAFMNAVLKERESYSGQDSPHRDFLSLLLSLPGENGAANLDPTVVKSFFLELLAAGTETTATALEWSLAELLRNPGTLQRVQSELDAVVGKERVVRESDVADLPYLQAVVKETLRLHPPVALLQHMSGRACQVSGYHIPANTTTFVNAWSIGRAASVWERPLEFLPDRFLDQAASADIDFRGQHFQLLPFGSGRRSCVGMNLALAQVHYNLARLLQAFEWSLPKGLAPQDLDMSERFGITLPRAKPLWAVLTRRLPAHVLH